MDLIKFTKVFNLVKNEKRRDQFRYLIKGVVSDLKKMHQQKIMLFCHSIIYASMDVKFSAIHTKYICLYRELIWWNLKNYCFI